ncbi:MAG TPA: histidine kinase, partial [Glycomyces sp.]|nr:histidine kinase [Glycomyces sp.]
SLLADAWAGQKPQAGQVPLSRSTQGPVASLVVPLVAEGRTVGLVAIESDDPAAFGAEAITAAEEQTKGAALRLETALLFEDVRSMATTEERQRLAREIHDGIAQELAMLGYGIDNAMAVLPTDATEASAELGDLRSEVTRLVTELRFSLFELRSNVDRRADWRRRSRTMLVLWAPQPASGCTCRSTRAGPDCPPVARPSCCGSRKRPSRTPASTPAQRTCG